MVAKISKASALGSTFSHERNGRVGWKGGVEMVDSKDSENENDIGKSHHFAIRKYVGTQMGGFIDSNGWIFHCHVEFFLGGYLLGGLQPPW